MIAPLPPGNEFNEEEVVESNKTNIDERVSEDEERVAVVLQAAGNDDTVLRKVVRVGHTGAKPRPAKAILSNPQVVQDILKRKIALLSENIKVGSDRTKMQHQRLQVELRELNARKKNREIDLSLKYVRGVPTTAKSNKKNRISYHLKDLLSECWRHENKTH
ncbi:hypothetical protein HHI36_016811 [Cryptolaemus montrouzieri]|uniref:Uncharacterized protein n=1 Tax=Cryptolaemus montrouzieri TaxID=559131 RepID=A0ABD2NKW2_9CUCU